MAPASRRHSAKSSTETSKCGGAVLQLRRSPPGRGLLFTRLPTETVWKLAKVSRWCVFGGATGQRLSFFTPFYRLVGLQFDAYPDLPNSFRASILGNPYSPTPMPMR